MNGSRVICFFYPHPLCDIRGGTERVTNTLADMLEGNSLRVLFLSYEEHRSRRNDVRQHYISRHEISSKIAEFINIHKVDCIVYQDGAVPVPFDVPSSTHCRLITVLHYAPDFYTDEYWVNWGRAKTPSWMHFFWRVFRRSLLNQIGLFLLRYRIGKIYAQTLKKCDAFVLLSSQFIPQFRQLVGKSIFMQEAFKVCAIPNPSVFVSSPKSEKKREILFVGRLENGQKRVDLLLKIWARLEHRFPNWNLRIVGDGPDIGSLTNLKRSLGLENVSFEGFRSPWEYYKTASIFCVTSSYEGFGLVIPEAMSGGCVPVAFLSERTLVFKDIISHEQNGILVPEGDIEKYESELERLMCDGELRKKLGDAARRCAEMFSPDKIKSLWAPLISLR